MNTRKEYIELLVARLHELDSRIDMLRSRINVSEKKARLMYKKRLVELEDKRERAAEMLTRMHETGEETWAGVRREADRLFKDLKERFRKAA